MEEGIISRAVKKDILTINFWNPRDYATDRFRHTDDYPYGGKDGVIFKPEPLFRLYDDLLSKRGESTSIYLSPRGRVFDQDISKELSLKENVILLCGRYKGVDQRVLDKYVDYELSIGDFVLSGGEIPAMAVIDSVARMIPGVVGNFDSLIGDSFQENLLDCDYYTRPSEIDGMKVPQVLLEGHHKLIEEWKRSCKIKNTYRNRKDLLKKAHLDDEELHYIERLDEDE